MRLSLAIIAAAGLGAALPAAADSLVFNYDTIYTDKNLPSGPAPWIQATFASVDQYTVSLDVKSLSLAAGEFVTFWGFNVSPNLDPSTFDFKLVSSVNYSGANNVTTGGQNSAGAGGSVQLDFNLNFGSKDFSVGSDVMFYITSTTPISVSDFDVTTTGDKSGYFSSAHIQGLANGKSAWVDPSSPSLVLSGSITTVPESSTMAAVGFISAALGASWLQKRMVRH